jgi:(2R)-3-sulfolactate dehydrogenase (NADP+)
MQNYAVSEVHGLCLAAAMNAGASQTVAQTLADATLEAELRGRRAVGLAHFFDFLHGFRAGSIDGTAIPDVAHDGCTVWVDARGGIPHTGFNAAGPLLVDIARKQGCAVFMQHNSYTAGELGYFTDHLAKQGLLAFASANSPALLAVGGSRQPVLGTNPMSMTAPLDEGPPLMIDQAASNVAYVSIREAARDGRPIPEGWAVDSDGTPTTEPLAALDGALLPFGGHKGANMAIMAEVLAGLAGGNWSVDAPSFLEGERSPGIGMFILVIDPTFRERSFPRRLRLHLERLQRNYGVRLPGRRGARAEPADGQKIPVPENLFEKLRDAARQSANVS